MAAEPVLTVSDLHAGYGDLDILHGIDLSIVPGVTTVIGPNGAGKSTLLKAIFGMARITDGSIRLGEIELRHLSDRQLLEAGLAFVPQGRCNFPRMPVHETLEMAALAQVALPLAHWRELSQETHGELKQVWRPRELP